MSPIKSLFQPRALGRRSSPPAARGGDFRPDRDWRLLFGGFLVSAAIVFAGSVYLYRLLDTLEMISQRAMTKVEPVRLNQAALDRAVADLGEKKSRFDDLSATPPPIVDPSR